MKPINNQFIRYNNIKKEFNNGIPYNLFLRVINNEIINCMLYDLIIYDMVILNLGKKRKA